MEREEETVGRFIEIARDASDIEEYWKNCALTRNHRLPSGQIINISASKEAVDLAFERLGIRDSDERYTEEALRDATAVLYHMHREGWPRFRGEPAAESPTMEK